MSRGYLSGLTRRYRPLLNGQRIAVVLPAYNAALTLAKTVSELDRAVIDDVLLVDDASLDDTERVARSLDLAIFRHDANTGYGGNQKTCYRLALARGADIIVMLHPDYQYSGRLVTAMAAMVAYGEYDLVLGSRILAQHSVRQGMPRYKYVANRALTLYQNLITHSKLSEYHTGFRAYRRQLLLALPLDRNSDDFVFDNELVMQALMLRARIGEISCPTRYSHDSSSITFGRSIRYGLGVLRAGLQYRVHKMRLMRIPYLRVGGNQSWIHLDAITPGRYHSPQGEAAAKLA